MTLEQACGAEPGLLCESMLDLTGSGAAARAVDVLVVRPGRALLVVAVAVVLYRIGIRMITRFTDRYESEIRKRVTRAEELGVGAPVGRTGTRRYQRLYAIASAGRSGLAIVLGVTAFLVVLAQFVNLGPLLAGAGIAGLVVGFGAQNLISDLLAGFSMLVEDQYGVGDWIDVGGRIGEVERVGLRTTSFRDIDGTVWHLPNGKIDGVGNLTQRWARATLDVPMALDTDVAHARRVVSEVAMAMSRDPQWREDVIADPEIWGLTAWGPDGLRLRVVIPTRPLRNWDVNRQLRERLKVAFEAEGIRMPAPMVEVGGQTTTGVPVQIHQPEQSSPRSPAAAPAEHVEGVQSDDVLDVVTTGRIATEYARVRPRQGPEGRQSP